ncbi:MAG: serine/threonine-protein kinase [Pseudomonadota bacterium]
MSANWGPGTIILGRYRLESILGRGGMGSVWRAEHLQLRSPVAIKLLDDAISHNQQMLTRFMREAQAAALLRSPHVVQIFDVGVEDGTAFIAMELLRGESLAERIARLKQLPAEEVIGFLSQVLRAIAKAHEAGIVHRDLKPDNIFICAEEPEFAKVLDFGVAKVTAGELSAIGGGGTQPGMMIGTPYYMSPEQMRAKDVDARADLWSIAVIAYECMVGVRPFTGDELGELVIAICTGPAPIPSQNASVPPGFDEWFVKATQRDRDRRFGSAREMAEELIKLSSAVGPSRPQFTTVRNIASIPVPGPRPKASSSRAPSADNLDLTTGQRAATSESLEHSRAPLGAPVYALIVAAALIVAGVGAFVAFGGASVFKGAVAPGAAAATLTTTMPIVAAASPVQTVSAASALPGPSASATSASAASSKAAASSSAPAAKSKAPRAPKNDVTEFGLRR